MSKLPLICDYCAHRNHAVQSRCAHCGAPLAATAPELELGLRAAADVARGGEKTAGQVFGAIAAMGRAVSRVENRAEPGEHSNTPRHTVRQWKSVIAGLSAMLVVAVGLVRCCSIGVPPVDSWQLAGDFLPAALRTAAICHPVGAGADRERCVIAAADPILSGDLAGGRDLALVVEVGSPDQLSAELNRWRSSGGMVLSDAGVFAAIGPSSVIWYADIQASLRIETGAFASVGAAKAFLQRSGLLR